MKDRLCADRAEGRGGLAGKQVPPRPGIIPAPYLARAKWVRVENGKALSDKEAAALLRRSYELVFAKLSKKLQREILEAQ